MMPMPTNLLIGEALGDIRGQGENERIMSWRSYQELNPDLIRENLFPALDGWMRRRPEREFRGRYPRRVQR